jgi:carboxymethylenebutenolidase
MCDDLTNEDNDAYFRKRGITRREVSKLGAGAALSAMLPLTANAEAVVEQDVMVETPDGMADCYFVHPASGRHAAVIIWPDILGLRPAFRTMGKRLAESGYSVLVVNPFYRSARAPVVAEGASFSDPDVRATVGKLAATLSPTTCVTDGSAFVDFLDQQSVVDTDRKIGTTGYCMGGSYTLRLAAAIPDRIGAGGSFHGGRLATDQPDSPHLLADKIKAGMLIAIAENDDERDPQAKTLLREAFDNAGVQAEVEVYAGSMHGWCPPDSRVYNETQAEHAWERLLALFARELS